jgi:regulator of nucleoside diphosphate kinase
MIEPVPARGSTYIRPPIVLTATDHTCLSSFLLAGAVDARVALFLREELDRAEILHQEVPPTILARIGSTLKIVDDGTTHVRKIKLASPHTRDSRTLVSVAGALGTALIGLGPGQTIEWCDGKTMRRTTVLEIS